MCGMKRDNVSRSNSCCFNTNSSELGAKPDMMAKKNDKKKI